MPYAPIRPEDISPSGRIHPDCAWHAVHARLLDMARAETPGGIGFMAVEQVLAALGIALPLRPGTDADRAATLSRMNQVIAQFNAPQAPRSLAELQARVEVSGDPVGAAMARVRAAMAPFSRAE